MTTHALTLREPHELLAIIPFVLGFHPTRSIVVLCLHGRRLGLTQRLDLPHPEHARDAVSALLPSLLTEGPDAVILIGFEDRAGQSLPALDAMTIALQPSAIEIHDRIVVRHSRWRSLDCDNPDCCPLTGSPVPEPSDVPGIVAEFIGQGVCPHPDREALARQLEAGPQAVAVARVLRCRQKAQAKAADSQALSRAELFAAWPRILNPDSPAISPEDAASAAISLQDIEIRDGLVAWMSPGTLNINELSPEVQELFCGLDNRECEEDTGPASTEAQNRRQDALIRLCAMLPDHMAAPALSVLASFVWWRGNGALARIALDRALRCDPDYRLAQLLERMVALAIRPVAT